ncbi:hypothetical protein C2W62_30470 [Candidatus Entotheonella serta]|nr:hypothetical protein C2W62_30470 [Candidatus Entotheonella serta]
MRKIITRLLPWLITAGIFTIIFTRIPVSGVIEALSKVSFAPYLALMLPYSLFYCCVDTFVLTRVIHWFHQPVPYRRLLPIRASSYILSLLVSGLGQGGLAFYVHRREGLPFLALAGTMMFLGVMEFIQLALYASIGILAFYPHLVMAFAPLYIILIAVIGIGLLLIRRGAGPLQHLLGWLSGAIKTRLHAWFQQRDTGLFNTFRQVRVRHAVLTLLYKAPNFLMAVIVQQAALQLFDVEVPLTRLFTMLPIVFLAASVPGTVAHLGTSQAAWLYVFADYGTEAQILAYSLVAHVTFMVLNSLIGLVFMPFAIKGLRDTSGSAEHTDAPGPTTAPEPPTG